MNEQVEGLRDQYRQQILASIGGWSGTIITAVPTVVFVVVNTIAGLRWAILAALSSAVLLAAYRLLRRQPIQQALTGLIGVVVASLIAARTGHAKGYFLLGIWSSFLYAGVFIASLAARRPIVGLLWEFLDPTPGEQKWYRRRPLLLAYDLATALASLIFLSRGIVQLALFRHNDTGWLAVARILMGYPLYVATIGFGFYVITRARRRLVAAHEDAGPSDIVPAEPSRLNPAD
ncbi:MAG: DUF3159 domain-containing protein [Actinobacteria bacterium]|nr:DUF3159 domain-containing protein [Actinomycetota bacterium]